VAIYENTAAKGHTSSQYNLGLHLEYGEGFEAPDKNQARTWYEKAAAKGHHRAAEAIRLLNSEQQQASEPSETDK
jgi:TPR repeat protein